MSRVKIVFTVAFVMTLCAGVAVGMLSAKLPSSHGPRSWMGDELNLSPVQREQMREIWQDVSRNRQRDWERRRAIEKERNDAVVALLSSEQKEKYDAIQQRSQQQLQEISRQREDAFQQATERTRQILTSEQRVKYESIMQKRREGRDSHNRALATEPSARAAEARSTQ